MTDITELREKRYEEARKLWDDDFLEKSPYRKSFSTVNCESLRVFELENEFAAAKEQTMNIQQRLENEVCKLEERAEIYTKSVSEMEQKLEAYNKQKSQVKASIEKEIKSDNKTFKKAENTLEQRIQEANKSIEELNEIIDSIEIEVTLKNERAQELLEQLRALLAAQSKELLFLEHQQKTK